MEKVFASVRSPLEISVSVVRTSQSPFPLYAMLPARLQKLKFFKDRTKSKDLLKTKSPNPKFILFPSRFFANPHQHICKTPMLNQTHILQKSWFSPLLSVFIRIFCDERKNHTATLSSYILSKFLKTKPYPYQWINIFQKHPFHTMSGSFH